MKKLITAALASVMLITSSAMAVDFEDTRGHWAEATIRTLADRGVINGITDTTYAPDGNVTRAQYLKMIMEATGVAPSPYREGECLELRGSEWYAPYLQKALDIGLVPHAIIAGFRESVEYSVDDNGTATSSKTVYSGAFNGDLPISREEMAVLTQYFYQYTRTVKTNSTADIEGAIKFLDGENISDWAEMSVKLATVNGFIDGMDDNTFRPADSATRAQAATIILRVMNKSN